MILFVSSIKTFKLFDDQNILIRFDARRDVKSMFPKKGVFLRISIVILIIKQMYNFFLTSIESKLGLSSLTLIGYYLKQFY